MMWKQNLIITTRKVRERYLRALQRQNPMWFGNWREWKEGPRVESRRGLVTGLTTDRHGRLAQSDPAAFSHEPGWHWPRQDERAIMGRAVAVVSRA